jgi:hypothetical protein
MGRDHSGQCELRPLRVLLLEEALEEFLAEVVDFLVVKQRLVAGDLSYPLFVY